MVRTAASPSAVTGTTLPASGRHLDAITAFGDRDLRLVSTRADPAPANENLCWGGVARDAAFLAESHWRPVLDACHLVRLAVGTIHETAGVRPEVGGPVQVGVLDPDGPRLLAGVDAEAVRPGWLSAEKAATALLAEA